MKVFEHNPVEIFFQVGKGKEVPHSGDILTGQYKDFLFRIERVENFGVYRTEIRFGPSEVVVYTHQNGIKFKAPERMGLENDLNCEDMEAKLIELAGLIEKDADHCAVRIRRRFME